jgi:hypothetical protein
MDRDLECELAISPEFQRLIETALAAGWSDDEVANALLSLTQDPRPHHAVPGDHRYATESSPPDVSLNSSAPASRPAKPALDVERSGQYGGVAFDFLGEACDEPAVFGTQIDDTDSARHRGENELNCPLAAVGQLQPQSHDEGVRHRPGSCNAPIPAVSPPRGASLYQVPFCIPPYPQCASAASALPGSISWAGPRPWRFPEYRKSAGRALPVAGT